MATESTKTCPNCNNSHLVQLPSLNEKHCTDCHTRIDWYLDKGQKPLN